MQQEWILFGFRDGDEPAFWLRTRPLRSLDEQWKIDEGGIGVHKQDAAHIWFTAKSSVRDDFWLQRALVLDSMLVGDP